MKFLLGPHRIKQAGNHQGLVLSQTRIEWPLYKGRKKQQGHLHLHHQMSLWTHCVPRIGSIKQQPFMLSFTPGGFFFRNKTKTIYLSNNTLLWENKRRHSTEYGRSKKPVFLWFLSLQPLFLTTDLMKTSPYHNKNNSECRLE